MFSQNDNHSDSTDESSVLQNDSSSSDDTLHRIPARAKVLTEVEINDGSWNQIAGWTSEGLDFTCDTSADVIHLSIGIDEAGRGAAIGSLVYGICAVEVRRFSFLYVNFLRLLN